MTRQYVVTAPQSKQDKAGTIVGKSADAPTPLLTELVKSGSSLIDAVNSLMARGQPHQAADEMHRLAAASDSLTGATRPGLLDKAERATDPSDRRSYTELAKAAEAGAR